MPAASIPTVINGGIINAYGSNARLGAGDWMVVEADESDGTFLKLPTDVAIVTNVDPEHLDHFKTFEAVQDAFRAFRREPAVLRLCRDVHRSSRGADLVGKIEDRRIITYGENPQADVRLRRSRADGRRLEIQGRVPRPQDRRRARDRRSHAADAGTPQRLNATAAIAVARELGISDEAIRKAIAGFGGVKRRFTKTGEWNGVTVIDDYGHHPVEIAAVLKAARESTNGKIVAVVQPHRYHPAAIAVRGILHLLQRCRCGDRRRVYAAGEAPIEGIDRDHFVAGPARPRPPRGDPAAGAPELAASSRAWQAAAISSCASAPATSRNGPTRCRAN